MSIGSLLESRMLPYPAKSANSFYIVVFNICGVLVFGGQNLSSYFASTTETQWFVFLCIACGAYVPAVGLEMYWFRDKSGQSWHERYGETPASTMLVGILYACFWGMVVHVIALIATQDCDICGDAFPISSKSYYHAAYWIHVVPSGVIALFGPFQFTPKVRKYCDFCIHRWIGRLVLLASAVHQASATVLLVSNLFFNKKEVSYRIYSSAFIIKNMICWTATVKGFITARQKRIAEHGIWMYRLGGMWVVTIITAHVVIYPIAFIVGQDLSFTVSEWANLIIPILLVEIYVRKSGRFDFDPHSGKTEPAKNEAMCPFLAQGA